MIKILLVDDIAEEREINRTGLSRCSNELEIVEAGGAREAMDILAGEGVDCIVSDLRMPGIDGLRLLQELRDRGDETPFILLTGQGNEMIAAGALRSGADDYYTKEEVFSHFPRLYNRILKVVGAFRTKRKHDEATRAFAGSGRKYRCLIEGAADPLIIIKDEKIVYVSPRMLEFSGYSGEEVLRKPFTDFVSPEERAKVLGYYNRRMAGDHSHVSYETVILAKDGTPMDVGVNAGSIMLEDGLAVIAFIHDITERKRRERDLSFFKFAVDSTPDFVIWMNSEGRFIYANDSVCRVLGYCREELLSMSVYDIDPSCPRELWSRIWADLKVEKHSFVESRLTCKDGRVIPVEISSNYLEYEGVEYNCAILRDVSDRLKSASAILEKSALLGAVIKTSRDAIVAVDKEGTVLVFNPAAEGMFGIANDEIIGRPLDRLIPPEHLERHAKSFKGFFNDGYPNAAVGRTIELAAYRNDGSTFNIELSLSVGRMQGKPLLLAIIRDITWRKRAEDELKENERIFRSLFEQANDAVFRLSLDGIYLDANHKAADLLGYSREELIGMKFRDIVAQSQRAESEDKHSALLAGEILPLYGRIFRTKSGKEIAAEINVALVRDGDGDPVFIQSIVRDVSERKRAEEALRESEEKFRKIVEHAHDAIAIVDLEVNFLFANGPARELLVAAGDESLLGKNAYSYLTEETVANARAGYEVVLRDGVIRNLEVDLIRPNGGEASLEVTGSLLKDAESKPVAILIIARDITERKKAEEGLKKSNVQLAAINQELEAFSYSVSHDLKSPLRHISGFSDILEFNLNESDDENVKAALKGIKRSVGKMSLITDELLRMFRSTSGELELADTSISDLAREVFEELRGDSSGRAVDFKLEEGLIARCDEQLIGVVLQNLLGNAWKFSGKREKAIIELGAERKNGQRVFFVRDNGVGFDPARADRMFMPFHRLNSGEGFEGTGVGLSIVQRIIHKHGGRIWADSAPGEGATLYFTLGE